MRIESAAQAAAAQQNRPKVSDVGDIDETSTHYAGQQRKQAPGGLNGLFDQLSRVLEPAKAAPTVAAPQPEEPDPAIDRLADALRVGSTTTQQISALLNRVDQYGDQRLFFQGVNHDVYLSAANSVEAHGGNLSAFLATAGRLAQAGEDLDAFMAMTVRVMDKGDYDDLDRFIDVTNTMIDRGQDLEAFYALGDRFLADHPADFETVVFDAQTFVSYGGSIRDFTTIADNLGLAGFEGRNNSVDFHRVLVDARNHGGSVPIFFRQMAEKAEAGQSIREYLDDYMNVYGLTSTRPNPADYSQLQRIDGNEPLELVAGEHSALFAQAISSRDGLLPSGVLYWSSDEDGALGHGDTLDLSTLSEGIHHIAVKIGGYPGTDTAKQTVIVKARDPNAPGLAPLGTAPPRAAEQAAPRDPVLTVSDLGELFASGRRDPGLSLADLWHSGRAGCANGYFPMLPFGPGYFDCAQMEYREEMWFAVFDDGKTVTEAYFWRRQLSVSLMMEQAALDNWVRAYENELATEREVTRRLARKERAAADQLITRLSAPHEALFKLPEAAATVVTPTQDTTA